MTNVDVPIRPKIVIGNWKMCRSADRLGELEAIADAAGQAALEVVLCVPFPLIDRAASRVRALTVGAQDCHHEDEGAHTGSTSAAMLRECGSSHVLVGHSERRAAFRESDADVRAKAVAAARAGLIPVICVGETWEERRQGRATQVVARQIAASLPADLAADAFLVAYEPVWAIGSGLTPTADQIAEMHACMRQAVGTALGDAAGSRVRLLYGGSVKGDNAGWILAVPEVDGVLVGAASLTARDFVPIMRAAAASGPSCERRAA